jgi:hypothetical protein
VRRSPASSRALVGQPPQPKALNHEDYGGERREELPRLISRSPAVKSGYRYKRIRR